MLLWFYFDFTMMKFMRNLCFILTIFFIYDFIMILLWLNLWLVKRFLNLILLFFYCDFTMTFSYTFLEPFSYMILLWFYFD